MEDQQEPDYDKQYSDSFTKKIPFPILKYDICKFNPQMEDMVYTLATASVHDNTNFKLYTSPETKTQLTKIVAQLKEEDIPLRKAEERKKAEEKEKKRKEKEKEEEEKKKGDLENGDAPVENNENAEEEKKDEKKDARDPTERALLLINEQKGDEKDTKKLEKAHHKKESSKIDIPEPSLQKGKSSHNEDKKNKDENLSKESQKIVFEEVEIDDTFNKNLKNCKSKIIFTYIF